MSNRIMASLQEKYPQLRTKGFLKAVRGYVDGLRMFADPEPFDEDEEGNPYGEDQSIRDSIKDLSTHFHRVPDGWMWGLPSMVPKEYTCGLCYGAWWVGKPILVAVEIEVHNPLSYDKLIDYTNFDEFCRGHGIGFMLLRVDRYGQESWGDPEWFELEHPANARNARGEYALNNRL